MLYPENGDSIDLETLVTNYVPDKDEEDRCPWLEFLSARLCEWGSKPETKKCAMSVNVVAIHSKTQSYSDLRLHLPKMACKSNSL
jgi:hypothetical protein